MQEVSGSIPLFSTKKALYFAGSTVFFFLLKPMGTALLCLQRFRPNDTPKKEMLPPEQTGQSKASESSGGSISHLCLWFGQVWVQRYSTHASYPAGSRW